jgi:outer membrane receptor protein involved in Fe transport
MKKWFTLFFLLVTTVLGYSQTVRVYGKVTDAKDGKVMEGVAVQLKGTTNGALTDETGYYEVQVEKGAYTLEFSYLGYGKRQVPLAIGDDRERKIDVVMEEEATDLDIMVVTDSKYEKKLGEEVGTMEVLKAQVITQNNARMDEALNKVPGVNMLGKSISIRGGSGFSDATGNRVLGLLDEMPIISPENGSINWPVMPIEALEQVEVIKGSSSAMYGSSALNGVLNFRTVNPKPEMVNKLLINYGLYDQPKNKKWNWWWKRTTIQKDGDTVSRTQHPMFGGVQFLHAKQYGDFGVVVSGSYQQDQGFRQNNDYKRARMFAKFRYTPHKVQGLTVGLNAMFYHENSKDYFSSQGLDSLMYIGVREQTSANGLAVIRARTVIMDPYVNYYDKKQARHSLKFRFYNTMFNSTAGDSTETYQFYADYSYSKKFDKIDLVLTTGFNGFVTHIIGKTFGSIKNKFFSTRDVFGASAYVQVEKKFLKKITISGGMRLEYAKLDTSQVYYPLYLISQANRKVSKKHYLLNSPIVPLFRIGINYQPREGTYIRASFGQGFRYPAIAEKFVRTVRSGAEVYPNPNLKPESGWSAELGIKQGVKVSKWMAYFDLVGFYTQYREMIDFQVLYQVPPDDPQVTFGIPFKAQNVGHARVMGVEASAVASGQIFNIPLNFLVGYSYLYPENLDYNPADPTSTRILKYRIQHSFKADFQIAYKGVTLGASCFYNSFMKEVDNTGIGALVVVKKFRETHNKGDFVLDLRSGYNYKDKLTFNFIVKNVANTEYTLRPALIEAPRNYTFQIGYNF